MDSNEIPDVSNVPSESFAISSLTTSENKALKVRLRKELEQIEALRTRFLDRIAENSFSKNAELLNECRRLLASLLRHPYSRDFKKPVDPVRLNIPDYFNVIKNPMDLGTIRAKFASGMYSNPDTFASDVRLTFSNAMTYNPPENPAHLVARDLSNIFELNWESIEKKIVEMNQAEESKIPSSESDATSRRMAFVEKKKLGDLLESLVHELPDHIIEFLMKNCDGQCQISGDELEIDILAIADSALYELQDLLEDFCTGRKLKPIEIEASKSSNKPSRGRDDAADEEVDIMGDDNPVSGYPPVEIERDPIKGKDKCSSPSRSSSESGSSYSGECSLN